MDFGEAFLYGIEQADIKEIEQQEIDSVFQEMSEAIKSRVGWNVKILRGWTPEHGVGTPPTRDHFYLVAKTGSCGKKIAQIYQPGGGYPIQIDYGRMSVSAYDKESLESVLIDMLKDPAVAMPFKKLRDKWSASNEGFTPCSMRPKSITD